MKPIAFALLCSAAAPAAAQHIDSLAEGCTSIVVTPAASASAAAMTTHTDDCMQCDFRIGKVPAATHVAGAARPLFAARAEYPRYLGDLRGATYTSAGTDLSVDGYDWREGDDIFAPIGSIEQLGGATYGYLDGGYGIMNDQGVAMGESTCGGQLTALPVSQVGG